MKSFIHKHIDRLGILMGAVFFVGLGFMAQTILETDRSCLRFSGVIELHVDGVEAGARACAQTSRFSKELYSERMLSYIKDINDLESMEAVFPSSQRGVFVTVTDKDPFFLLFSERSLILGSELAGNPAVFKRILLSALAFQNSSGENSLVKEVRADLLWYFYAGDASWTDPTMGLRVDPKKWLKLAGAPLTVQDYCSNPLRKVYDLSFCRFELEKDRPLPLEKRYEPLISWTVYKFLQDSGMGDRTRYLRGIFQVSVPPLKEDDESKLSAEAFVRFQVARFLKLSKESLDSLEPRLASLWEPLQITAPGSFDFVVEVEGERLKDEVLNSLTEWQKNTLTGRRSKVLLIGGEEQLELPLAQKVHYPLKEIRSKTHLVLGCHLPQIRAVASLNASHLIALKVCHSSDLPQWADILKEGEGTQTAQLRMDLHLPSLRRWSRHRSKILAANQPIDRIFCRPELYQGYPFRVQNCAGIQ